MKIQIFILRMIPKLYPYPISKPPNVLSFSIFIQSSVRKYSDSESIKKSTAKATFDSFGIFCLQQIRSLSANDVLTFKTKICKIQSKMVR